MKRIGSAAVFTLALALWACHGAGPLPSGGTLGGFADIEQPESYTGATLYTYMDGGADFYVNQGFSELYVRRYGRGNERFIVELFEMKDASARRVFTRVAGAPTRRRNSPVVALLVLRQPRYKRPEAATTSSVAMRIR